MTIETVLLVEDEDPKRAHIVGLLERVLPEAEIRSARSVRSAMSALDEHSPDLLLLDMSLPTFDQGPDEPGGRPQGFGGIEVMRYMEKIDVVVPVVVVTAYEAFAHEGKTTDLQALREYLADEHDECFVDVVYFNSVFGGWSEELQEVIARIIRGGGT